MITVGNGEMIEPDAVGNLKVTICDKRGVSSKMSFIVKQQGSTCLASPSASRMVEN
jgi:hypothetical protein